MYKSNVGDFPLIVKPCEYWFVRYTVGCTRDYDLYDEETNKILKEAGIEIHSYHGDLSWIEITRNGIREEINNEDPQWKLIADRMKVNIPMASCPYENNDQSECPHYIESPFYKNDSLEEIRARKGYEV